MSQVFAFNSRQIRTVTENNEIWFAAVDVSRALGIPWNGNTTLQVIPAAWRGVSKFHTPSGKQKLITISEPAVYKLAFRSNKPEADAFTNWVASEVLPAIRKGGEYKAAPRQKAIEAQPRVRVISPSCNKELRTAADLAEAIRLVEAIRARVRREHRPREYRVGDSRDQARYEMQWDMFRACNSSLAAAVAALCAVAQVADMD